MKYFYFTKLRFFNFCMPSLHSNTQYFTALRRVVNSKPRDSNFKICNSLGLA